MTTLRLPLLSLASGLLLALSVSGQGQLNFALESRVVFPPCTVGDVWAIGDYMLVARRYEGFAVVDARDPANPIVKTIHPPGYPVAAGSLGAGDIKADGRYIYVSDESTGAGIYIYDTVPDPMNPTLLSTIGSSSHPERCHNCWIEGNYLFCQTRIYDVSDRSKPFYVGALTSGTAHDVIVIRDRAYLSRWNNGIEIYDVANPRLPFRIGALQYSNAVTHNMWPTDDDHYLYTTDEIVGGHVRVWDISALPAIREAGSYRVPGETTVHNVQVHGNLLFVSYYKQGVRVCSIADPTNPVEIAYYDTYPASTPGSCYGNPAWAGCWGVYPWDRERIFASDLDTGAYILRFNPVGETFTASGTKIAPGSTLGLSFAFQNRAPAPLDGFGLLLLDDLGGMPQVLSLFADVRNLAVAQSVSRSFQLPIPTGVPKGLTVGFTGYSGTFAPLIVSEKVPLSITVQ